MIFDRKNALLNETICRINHKTSTYYFFTFFSCRFRDLSILKMSDNWSPMDGGKTILMFCSKVSRHDIEIHFKFTPEGKETFVLY